MAGGEIVDAGYTCAGLYVFCEEEFFVSGGKQAEHVTKVRS